MADALCFDAESIGCFGGQRYLGFRKEIRPNFEYFLSCGIPGKMEGERYKKTPEIAAEVVKFAPPLDAPARFIVFKRWDLLNELMNQTSLSFSRAPMSFQVSLLWQILMKSDPTVFLLHLVQDAPQLYIIHFLRKTLSVKELF